MALLLLLRHLLIRIWAGLPSLPTVFLRLARSLAVIVDIPAIVMIVLVWSSSARTTNPSCRSGSAVVGLRTGVGVRRRIGRVVIGRFVGSAGLVVDAADYAFVSRLRSMT